VNSPSLPTLDVIRLPIAADMAGVDTVIRSRLDSDVALVRQVAEYIVHAGGKRLRPALTLLTAATVGGAAVPGRLELAAVIEFIHTATLLHDDVVDESELRRGRETANALFGNAASVLVGDFLYSRAFQMMVDIGSLPIMRVMADATNTIAEGEVLQLINIGDADITEDAYFRVVRYKTAKLFEAACRVGAMLAGASDASAECYAQYGMHLGVAFQLIDDVLDYSGHIDETGKNIGDDLAEGKPTLPLIHAMRVGSTAHVAAVRKALVERSLEGLPTVLAAIEATDALAYTRAAARAEANLAVACLLAAPSLPTSTPPPASARDSLLQLADFAVERAF
jgi:octaprenyl-diphosphate synthase